MVSKAVARIRPTPSMAQARQRSEGDGAKEPAMPKMPPINNPIEAVILVTLSFINIQFLVLIQLKVAFVFKDAAYKQELSEDQRRVSKIPIAVNNLPVHF